MFTLIWIIIFLVAMTALAYHRASLPVWSIGIFVLLLFLVGLVQPGAMTLWALGVIYVVIFGVLNIHPLRRLLITNRIFQIYKKLMPNMSETERAALESGTVGWEGDLFSGMPDWSRLHETPLAELTAEERAFMDGPVEDICRLVNNWKISREMQIPEEIWSIFKSAGFFGMIIPKKKK